MHFRLTKNGLFSLLVYIGVFLYGLYPYRDFDWGWHYRYGEYLLKYGHILRTNPFSWTLPDYRWVNHSWLYDGLLYIIYTKFSFVGLSIAGALIVLLIFYILLKPFSLTYWQKGLLALVYAPLMFLGADAGLRSLMMGFLFTAVTLTLLRYGERTFAYLYWLPLVFLAWVNFHGSFVVGLLILVIYSITYILNPHNNITKKAILGGVFLASAAVTLVNPFTYHIYEEVTKYWHNPVLLTIFDWHTMDILHCEGRVGCYEFTRYIIILVPAVIFACVKSKKLFHPFYLLLGVAFFYLTTAAQRNVPLFIIVTLPFGALLLSSLTAFAPKIKKIMEFIFLATIIVFLAMGYQTRIQPYNFSHYGFKEYCENVRCSEEAIEYLLQHPPAGRGLNYYDTGGFWTGRGVPAKLFVDGRMTVWSDTGTNPYADFIDIYMNGDSEKFIAYDFRWVYIETNSKLNAVLTYYQGNNHIGTWVNKYQDSKVSYWVRVDN